MLKIKKKCALNLNKIYIYTYFLSVHNYTRTQLHMLFRSSLVRILTTNHRERERESKQAAE